MNKSKKILIVFLFLALLFGAFEWMRADMADGADTNQQADFFCKGKGYDQGFEQDGNAMCATYIVHQAVFPLPQ